MPQKNLAYATVLTPPSPTDSGVTLVLDVGLGSRFPDPVTDGPFPVRIGPRNTRPLLSNSEFATCTARSGDTLTLVRAQESSSAIHIAAGYEVEAGPTAATFQAINNSISSFTLSSLFGRLAPADTLPIPAVAPVGDVPVVTQNASAQVSGQKLGPQGGLVTEVGSRGVWNSTFARLPVQGVTGLDFYLEGSTTVEIGVFPVFAGSCPLWIWVNGAPVTAAPNTDLTTVFATQTYVKLVFGDTARRRIEFFMMHDGAWTTINASIAAVITPAPRKPVVGFVGDSFWDGSTATQRLLSGAFLISRQLGVECFSQSLGGTGYIAPGPVTMPYGDVNRVGAMARAQPELILFEGTVNDDSHLTGLQAAAAAAFTAYETACPNAKFIVFSPQPTNYIDTIGATRASNIAAVKAAADADDNVIAFHDMCGTAAGVPPVYNTGSTYAEGDLVYAFGSVWQWSNGGLAGNENGPATSTRWKLVTYVYFGTGNISGHIGDGTRDTFLYSDNIHPTPPASAALAIRMAGVIRDDMQSGGI